MPFPLCPLPCPIASVWSRETRMNIHEGGNESKTNKWECIKLKTFCTARETIDKIKRQPTD